MAFKQGDLTVKLLLSFVISLLLLGSSTALAQSGELVMVGAWFSQYVSAKSGEVWLGLYKVGDEYELKASTLVVVDRAMDLKKIGVDQPTMPLFLVKGLEQLQPGKVRALMHGFLYPGQIQYLRSDLGRYSLKAIGLAVDRGPSQVGIQEYKLILSGSLLKQVSQTLVDWDEGLYEATTPGAIWAGDLDRDGKIDVFTRISGYRPILEYTLFLSSAANEGEYVGEVATWRPAVD